MTCRRTTGSVWVLVSLGATCAAPAPGDERGPVGPAAPAAKEETMGGLTGAVIRRQNASPDGPREFADVVSDPKQVRRLAAFFPGMGRGATSPESGRWEPLARIEFTRAGGAPLVVRVDPHLDVWTEGRGDWRLAPEFRGVFVGLLGDHIGAEEPGLPYAWGDVPKATRATVTRSLRTDRGPETRVTEVTDPAAVRRLAAFFPGAGQGHESPMAVGSVASARIRFDRPDAPPVAVSLDDRLSSWSEGHGSWALRPRFAEFFRALTDPGPVGQTGRPD